MLLELEAVALEPREYKNREGVQVHLVQLVCRDILGRGKYFATSILYTVPEPDQAYCAAMKFPCLVKLSPTALRPSPTGGLNLAGSLIRT